MSLHHDLLEQAKHLATREPKKPRQASLRRATSTAYYALFHLLLAEGARRLAPANPVALRVRVQRAFAHGEMRTVCAMFAQKPSAPVASMLSGPVEPQLSNLAATFIDLHEARQTADYDLAETFDRSRVLAYVARVESAFSDWVAIRMTVNATVFLAALLLNSKWNR